MNEWYGTPIPSMNRADKTIAASVRGLLEGDAGQRALWGWSLGWSEAQLVSGTDWLPPYLSELLVDPYPAVRLIAERSLRTLSGYESFRHRLDSTSDLAERAKAAALTVWTDGSGATARVRPEVLIQSGGVLDQDAFEKILKRRNNKKIRLVE